MSNKIKCLLLNLTLLAGVYCSWGCSCCADCYKKCCGKEDLYFKIEVGAIDNNNLKCFGEGWFEEYQKKKADNNNNAILLYKLTEQQEATNGVAGTLVYSKENEKLQYRNGGDLPASLKDSDNKWAIFKVTTLKEDNNQKQKGDSHIFYCSDVSSLSKFGLFERVMCWSIEILAANTQGVKRFLAMFFMTTSYLEQDIKQPDASGFIGLEKLDLSSAKNLEYMFYKALFKQKTINSLQTWHLLKGPLICQMFYMDISKFVDQNDPDFSVLKKWIDKNDVDLEYAIGSKYNIFFQGEYDDKNNDKLPEWYNDRLLKK